MNNYMDQHVRCFTVLTIVEIVGVVLLLANFPVITVVASSRLIVLWAVIGNVFALGIGIALTFANFRIADYFARRLEGT